MPSATARRMYEDQIPSFMTVFDLDAETIADRETVTLVDTKFVDMEPKAPGLMSHSLHSSIMSDPNHKHHDSTSTQTTESADSSPTTTLSTTDSSPLSDPSPSSSPDSPVNLIPLNNFPATSFGTLPLSVGNNTTTTTTIETGALLGVADVPRLQRPMTSPSPRRGRNMKGLSIQPPFAPSTSATAVSLVSEPSSPSFIKPTLPAPRRKPSQLSLKTNTSDLMTKTTLEVPPSPAMPPMLPMLQPPMLKRRALKHSTSSPHMLSGLKSSTFGPAGGMTFPKVLERNESGLSEVLRPMKSSMKMTFDAAITEEDSPITTQMANRSELEPYQEKENNEDIKDAGYPDGPIAIYGDNVYLYLEPTADEASRFDVVINCAREVKNPFEVRRAALEAEAQSRRNRFCPDLSPIPDTAVSTASFATAFEYPQEDSPIETPTTPKALPLKEPEYIHIPWDHNTDIAPDLMRLCELVQNRTREGKKVLIHCQQGASRSASLIIAYGMYQKPDLTVNDAYYSAQAKSQWISPNMKLMYSLQDFQKNVSKRRAPTSQHRTGRSPTKHRLTLSADNIAVGPMEPRTAPLPRQDETPEDRSTTHSPNRLRGNSTPGMPAAVSPGPASAPPTYNWRDEIEKLPPPPPADTLSPFRLADLPERPKSGMGATFPNLSLGPTSTVLPKPPPSPGFPSHASFGFQSLSSFPRVSDEPPHQKRRYEDQPVERTVAVAPAFPDDEALLSPRAEAMTNNPLWDFAETATNGNGNGLRFTEPQPSLTLNDGLFSPRASMFPRDPFSVFGPPPVVADPRSPPTKGEAPIIRSIDDLL